MARNLGLHAPEVERVRSAALLHDIGKVAIPDEILHKPGPLTTDEWQLMREHPVIGERILRVLPGSGRWPGSSATSTSAGTAAAIRTAWPASTIPLGSRIIIAADTYHAITSDRPYRSRQSHSRGGRGADALRRHAVRPQGHRGADRAPVRAAAGGVARRVRR